MCLWLSILIPEHCNRYLIVITVNHDSCNHCDDNCVTVMCYVCVSPGLDWAMSLSSLCAQYQAYLQVMDHWDTLLPGRVHHVLYEDVVLDTEREARRVVCDLLGLPWEQSVLDAHRWELHTKRRGLEEAYLFTNIFALCMYILCYLCTVCLVNHFMTDTIVLCSCNTNMHACVCMLCVCMYVQSTEGSAHSQHGTGAPQSQPWCYGRVEKVWQL